MPTPTEQHKGSIRSYLLQLLGWCNLALPVLLLLIIAVRTSVNIPIEDDYGAVGEFLERYVALHGFVAKAWWVLTSQFVQYKLMFLHTVVALEYQLTGHENYRVLSCLGDLSLPAVVLLLWFLLARSGRPLAQRIWLFSLPCYLYLSMCYVQTVNWAMSGLQNMAVIPFALASIFFVTSRVRRAFAGCLIFLALTIATSGNGFFAAAVVVFLLLWERRISHAVWAAALTVAMAVIYAYHYRVYMVSPPISFQEAVKSIVSFPFIFLGAATDSHIPAAFLGLLLVVGFAVLTYRGWRRVCPGSFGGALFCLVTAVGVTVTRYRGHGIGAVQGRYMMYGLLLLSLEYLAVLRLYAPQKIEIRSRWAASILAATVAAAFVCVFSDAHAYRELKLRKEILTTHLILWERHPDRLVVLPDEESDKQTPVWIKHRKEAQWDIQKEIATGLYSPPFSARDPLPVRTHSPATRDIENERP